MRIIKVWNKCSDFILDILRVVSILLILVSVIFIVVNIIKGVDDDIYKYGLIVVVMTYLNIKLNGG